MKAVNNANSFNFKMVRLKAVIHSVKTVNNISFNSKMVRLKAPLSSQ